MYSVLAKLRNQLARLILGRGPLTFTQEDPCHCRENHPSNWRV